MVKIVIDPGHGGTDPGATGNNLIEKDLNLRFARALRDNLQSNWDVKVTLTREDDTFVYLSERVTTATQQNADWFLSIHFNAHNNPLVRGFESYRHPDASHQSSVYQEILHMYVANMFQRQGSLDRGAKTADFYVLRRTPMPATLLELGFLTNDQDAALITSQNFWITMLRSVEEGIAEALKLKPLQTQERVPTEELNELIETLISLKTQLEKSQQNAFEGLKIIKAELIRLHTLKDERDERKV